MRDSQESARLYKIAFLFGIILFGFFIFLGSIISINLSERDVLDTVSFKKDKAVRGEILTSDGYHLASSAKLYKTAINTNTLNPDKKEVFIRLFSIYSGENESKIRNKINSKKGYVVLTDGIDSKTAIHLKSLANTLAKMEVFIPYESKALKKTIYLGLDVFESGEKRLYNYGSIFSPFLGYVRKKVISDDSTKTIGVKGVEGYYNRYLNNSSDGVILGKKDINKNIIINNAAIANAKIDGVSLTLNINMLIQKEAENIADTAKATYNAKEVLIAVMDSKTGKILTFASSNRYDPALINKNDMESLNLTAVENQYEPGSVIKPIIYSMLVEKNLIRSTEMFNGYNGKYQIGSKTITDTHKAEILNAEEILIESSNIGMAQIVQRLSSTEIADGLKNYGFTKKTDIDLSHEKSGYLVPLYRLESPIYKATISYGYSMQATFVQILKAYNVFNNFGIVASPRIVNTATYQNGYQYEAKTETYSVISKSTAQKMHDILIRIVKEGTGKGAEIAGLDIGGKTGTAHIAKGGKYVNDYISSFFGFANDDVNRYTIGVTIFEPEGLYFAAQTSVPVFKSMVNTLVSHKILKPKIIPIPTTIEDGTGNSNQTR